MGDQASYVLRVVPDRWDEGADPDAALPDIYNQYVQAGEGLTVWKFATDEERDAVVAIMVEKRGAPARGQLNLLVIPAEAIDGGEFAPKHTPEHADSSHGEAARLHHDVVDMDAAAARRFVVIARTHGKRLDLGRDTLVPVLETQASRFTDQTARMKALESAAKERTKLNKG